jgi:chromosome segregation ATPase
MATTNASSRSEKLNLWKDQKKPSDSKENSFVLSRGPIKAKRALEDTTNRAKGNDVQRKTVLGKNAHEDTDNSARKKAKWDAEKMMLEQRVATLGKILEEKNSEIHALVGRLETSEAVVQAAKEQEEETAAFRTALQEALEENEKLCDQLRAQNITMEFMTEKIEDMEEHYQAAVQVIEEDVQTIEELQDECDRLRASSSASSSRLASSSTCESSTQTAASDSVAMKAFRMSNALMHQQMIENQQKYNDHIKMAEKKVDEEAMKWKIIMDNNLALLQSQLMGIAHTKRD